MKKVLIFFCVTFVCVFVIQSCRAQEDNYCQEVSKQVVDCIFDDDIDIVLGSSRKKCPRMYFSSDGIDVHFFYPDFWDGYDATVRKLKNFIEEEKPKVANVFDKQYKRYRSKLKASHTETFLNIAKEKCLAVRNAGQGGGVYIPQNSQGDNKNNPKSESKTIANNNNKQSSKSATAPKTVNVIDCVKELQKRPVKINSQVKCSKNTATGNAYASALNGYKTACSNAVSNADGQGYKVGPKQDGDFYDFTCEIVNCKAPDNYELNDAHTKCVKKSNTSNNNKDKKQEKQAEIEKVAKDIKDKISSVQIGTILNSDIVKHTGEKAVKDAITAWDNACINITKPDGVSKTYVKKGFGVKNGGGANARQCLIDKCEKEYTRTKDETKCEKSFTQAATQNDKQKENLGKDAAQQIKSTSVGVGACVKMGPAVEQRYISEAIKDFDKKCKNLANSSDVIQKTGVLKPGEPDFNKWWEHFNCNSKNNYQEPYEGSRICVITSCKYGFASDGVSCNEQKSGNKDNKQSSTEYNKQGPFLISDDCEIDDFIFTNDLKNKAQKEQDKELKDWQSACGELAKCKHASEMTYNTTNNPSQTNQQVYVCVPKTCLNEYPYKKDSGCEKTEKSESESDTSACDEETKKAHQKNYNDAVKEIIKAYKERAQEIMNATQSAE